MGEININIKHIQMAAAQLHPSLFVKKLSSKLFTFPCLSIFYTVPMCTMVQRMETVDGR